MKLDQLRYFMEVVECGSLNKAAKNLYITQPTLTSAIHGLEAELNVPLLYRSNKGVVPTKYGLQIYRDCATSFREIESHMPEWKQFSSEQKSNKGIVHICAIPVICNFIMENLIAEFNSLYPDIDIHLHEINIFGFTDELQKNGYHIAITSIYNGFWEKSYQNYENHNLKTYVLLKDEYSLYCSSISPLKDVAILDIPDFANIDVITYSSSPSPDHIRDFYHPRKLLPLNNLGNILQAIAEGQGCGLFLHKALKDNWFVKHGIICRVPLSQKARRDSLHHLVYASEEYLSGAEKIVIQYIKDHYALFYNQS